MFNGVNNNETKYDQKSQHHHEKYGGWQRNSLRRPSEDKKKNKKLSVPCSVPQGSLMGPLLCNMCVNDLPNQLSVGIDKGLYADDFQFMIHDVIDNIEDMIHRANLELRDQSEV